MGKSFQMDYIRKRPPSPHPSPTRGEGEKSQFPDRTWLPASLATRVTKSFLVGNAEFPLRRLSSPNAFIGDPRGETIASWIPDQIRFGNDSFGSWRKNDVHQYIRY
jgi:hypothetical protein